MYTTGELDQNDVFTILSHPIRRKILNYIYDYRSISFSILSKEWGLKTGPIYHHLSKLEAVVIQNESNLYVLNETGKLICEKFLDVENGRTIVKKLDSFTLIANPVIIYLDDRSRLMYLSIILSYIFGIYFASFHNILVLGPFIIPSSESFNHEYLILINIGFLSLFLLLYTISNYLLNTKNLSQLGNLSIGYLFSLIPNYLFITFLHFLSVYWEISIPLVLWFIVSQISQLYFLFLNESYLVASQGISIERGILTILIHLYILVSMVLFII